MINGLYCKVATIASLLLLNIVSFGMELEVLHTNNRNKKKQRVVKTHHRTDAQKMAATLRKLHNSTHPEQVKKIINNKKVPMILLDMSHLSAGEMIDITIINPYHSSFYPKINSKALNKDWLSQLINVDVEKQKLLDQKNILLQNRTHKISDMGIDVPFGFTTNLRQENELFIIATLCGSSKNMTDALDWYIDNNVLAKDISNVILSATVEYINYPYRDKDRLAYLLSEQKKVQLYSNFTLLDRGHYSFYLLLWSAKNKEDFKAIADKDPYGMNAVPWKYDDTNNSNKNPLFTNLDRMFNNADFDSEHIEIFVKAGGVTMQQLVQEREEFFQNKNNNNEHNAIMQMVREAAIESIPTLVASDFVIDSSDCSEDKNTQYGNKSRSPSFSELSSAENFELGQRNNGVVFDLSIASSI